MAHKLEYCQRTLEVLLKDVHCIGDLDLIEVTISEYQDRFKISLIKYRLEIMRKREEYYKEQIVKSYKKRGHHTMNESRFGGVFV